MNAIPVTVDQVERIAKDAGAILLRYFRQKPRAWSKTPFELVSEADHASEDFIVSQIETLFPSHSIVAEETGRLQKDAAHVWIIDPLDGTLKFLLGEPYFSVSIAYEERAVLQIGVVFNPYTKDCYTAVRGRGAYRNGKPLHLSHGDDLPQSLVCCDWGGSRAMQAEGLHYLSRLLPPTTRGVGVNFSPALDLCNLAEGNVAAVVSNGTTPEDHSAGGLIALEAGGCVASYGRDSWSHWERGITAASTPQVLAAVTQQLAGEITS